MDPRIAWCPPEQLGKAHELWTRLWETQRSTQLGGSRTTMYLNNSNPNLDHRKAQEYIPLDFTNNFDQKRAPSNRQLNINNQRRKRDNLASTYGLNHSSSVHLLRENGGLTPWIPSSKSYLQGVFGYVSMVYMYIKYQNICFCRK